jgi:hypothetical protein
MLKIGACMLVIIPYSHAMKTSTSLRTMHSIHSIARHLSISRNGMHSAHKKGFYDSSNHATILNVPSHSHYLMLRSLAHKSKHTKKNLMQHDEIRGARYFGYKEDEIGFRKTCTVENLRQLKNKFYYQTMIKDKKLTELFLSLGNTLYFILPLLTSEQELALNEYHEISEKIRYLNQKKDQQKLKEIQIEEQIKFKKLAHLIKHNLKRNLLIDSLFLLERGVMGVALKPSKMFGSK